MLHRQTSATIWLVVVPEADEPIALASAARLAPGSGIVLAGKQRRPAFERRLRHLAQVRRLVIATEASGAAIRVHDSRELRRALLRRVPLILLSPIFETASHPTWRPLPLMRAATLARLSGRRLLALGGMDERRYARVAPLGFSGWAGISAFRT